MRLKLVYFAWVREKIGKEEEAVALASDTVTVGQLIAELKKRGVEYEAAFEQGDVIHAAINQEHAEHDELVKDGDEVALFPPMTGG